MWSQVSLQRKARLGKQRINLQNNKIKLRHIKFLVVIVLNNITIITIASAAAAAVCSSRLRLQHVPVTDLRLSCGPTYSYAGRYATGVVVVVKPLAVAC